MSNANTGKATWALLSVNKLPPGKFTEHTLGCVVTDIENPTDDWFPPDNSDVLKTAGISQIFEMDDTNAAHFQSSVSDMDIRMKLSDIFSSRSANSKDNETRVSSQTVITRILTAHPAVFDALKNMHEGELRTRLKNKKTLYMIVGFKTCVDADISSYFKQIKEVSVDVQVPVDKILLALGLPLTFGADLGVAGKVKKIQEYLSKHIATGERIFAVQYRTITTERTWFEKIMVLGSYPNPVAGLLSEDDDKDDGNEKERNDKEDKQDDVKDRYEEEDNDEDITVLCLHEMEPVDFEDLDTDCFQMVAA
ncbi:hypothetical protein FOXYS1_12311 [Fusarium oxysporum]|uniref:Uncharacterized protein n=1 Tax=Fusarium oxysporum TaxID=5507 RepID=A0A8H5A453_FUSOX|nr:hypothetical protein FOXYS1_12311 [Fusarium oxysporum]